MSLHSLSYDKALRAVSAMLPPVYIILADDEGTFYINRRGTEGEFTAYDNLTLKDAKELADMLNVHAGHETEF